MAYDFKTSIDRRNTGSEKWDLMLKANPNVANGVIPYSVADVDMKAPPELIKGLQTYLETAVLGYHAVGDTYHDAVIDWFQQEHHFTIQKEWIVNAQGVVGALKNCIYAYTKQQDAILILSPVYYPFRNNIIGAKRQVASCSLIEEDGYYHIDFESFEELAAKDEVTMFILCNPHNPIGRVWTQAELQQMADICLKHNVLVVSDEIHCDLVLFEKTHEIYANISEEAKNHCIVCTAPSKTFSIAGLKTSNIIIPNEQLRVTYETYVKSHSTLSLNIMGIKACEIVYTQCKAWKNEFVKLIEHNHILLKKYIETYIPNLYVYDLEATYLQWLDCRKLNMEKEQLEEFLTQECQLFFDGGYLFGPEGDGFVRINIACPSDKLMEGLQRLKEGIEKRG